MTKSVKFPKSTKKANIRSFVESRGGEYSFEELNKIGDNNYEELK